MQSRKKRTLFQFLLVGFSVLSLLLSSSMIQGGVTASIIPANNPGVQQCGGGSCPIPTQTASSVCNPYNWFYYDSKYGVKITSAETDKAEYHPGDPVTITGTVQLLRQDFYVNECGELGSLDPVEDNAGLVKMVVTGQFGGTITNKGGSFSAKVNVPETAESGPITYTVTASYSSAHDSRDVSFEVKPYTPSLAVAMSDGSFVYPGGQCTVSGSGWAPNGEVTLNYGSLGAESTAPVGGAGTFNAPSITVPSDADEGDSYTVTATEALLTAKGTIVVKWHQLSVSLVVSPASAKQGDNATISGTVVDNEGKGVEASVSFLCDGLPEPSALTTDASGHFSTQIAIPNDAEVRAHAIKVYAGKTGGYKDASTSASLQVVERPVPVVTAVGLAAGAAGLGAAATAAGLSSRTGSEPGQDDANKPRKKTQYFRARILKGQNLGVGLVGFQSVDVEIQEWDDAMPNPKPGEIGDWGDKTTYHFTGIGWNVGVGYNVRVGAGNVGGTVRGEPSGWQDFNTTKLHSLEDFGGTGNVTKGPSVTIVFKQYNFMSTHVTFGNGESVNLPGGLGTTYGLNVNLFQCQSGRWW